MTASRFRGAKGRDPSSSRLTTELDEKPDTLVRCRADPRPLPQGPCRVPRAGARGEKAAGRFWMVLQL